MPSTTPPKSSNRRTLHGIPYEKLKPGKPPIPITVAPPPSSALGVHPSMRPSSSPVSGEVGLPSSITRSKLHDDIRRDSGLAPSQSTARGSRTTIGTDVESAASIKKSPSLSRINSSRGSTTSSFKKFQRRSNRSEQRTEPTAEPAPKIPEQQFLETLSAISTISFDDLTSPQNLQFNKRGSLFISGMNAKEISKTVNGVDGAGLSTMQQTQQTQQTQRAQRPSPTHRESAAVAARVMSSEDEMLSLKVRSMYETGTDQDTESSFRKSAALSYEGFDEETADDTAVLESPPHLGSTYLSVLPSHSSDRASSFTSRRDSFIIREEQELAGGIEDWQDVDSQDVDRYGFIVPRAPKLPNASSSSLPALPTPRLHRATTLLQLASDAPRRQRSRIGRTPPSIKTNPSFNREVSSESAKRPTSSQSSYRSGRSSSRIRIATNRLPHNRERRTMDEASDMLTLPPGLAAIAEHEEGGKAADQLKRKEWQREDKWRKMARSAKSNGVGGGMTFDFDIKNPKLIERTWKGIPDSWRATAWHAFLSASAKKRRGSPSDHELVATFQELVDQSSPDDVQIDIDVPRTINSHIMFRRRYRGGQRLLFRVLHSVSLYFPATGYVQGMAALAATLLCYFNEEMAFIMLVRMWDLRGLAHLYEAGFDGLMSALDELEKSWLDGGEIAVKLNEHGISPTAYGTRWYLTIFNYSIPFPAQLRVWDVFMLLGDPDPVPSSTPGTSLSSYNGGLDVLHATSAALIDGMREILLDSDFEGCMKVLTSWIPIRDEELLMRVAKAEWKLHRRKA